MMKNNVYEDQLQSAIYAVQIQSTMGFSWFGNMPDTSIDSYKLAITDETARDYLLLQIQAQLYKNFYCQGIAIPSSSLKEMTAYGNITPFSRQLSEHNQSGYCWSSGWKVLNQTSKSLEVKKNGLALEVPITHCRSNIGQEISLADEVSIIFPNEMFSVSPGYYMAMGEMEFDSQYSGGLVRLYWHIIPKGAGKLLKYITKLFNQAELMFNFKLLNNPENYSRCDAAVLYLYRDQFSFAIELLENIYDEVKNELLPGVPALTKLLAPGLGLAEDPGQGESFGWQRCELIADSLIHSFECKITSKHEKFDSIVETFTQASVDINHPYLNYQEDSSIGCIYPDANSFAKNTKHFVTPLVTAEFTKERKNKVNYLETALTIANKLTDKAIWSHQRCTWFGAALENLGYELQATASYSTLSENLYDGNSGVATFLSHAAVISKNEIIRNTAIGAMKQALYQLSTRTVYNSGLFTGALGVVKIGVYIGKQLDEKPIIESSFDLAIHILDNSKLTKEFDIVSGSAGDILALIFLYSESGNQRFIVEAKKRADLLIENASFDNGKCSWRIETQTFKNNLTGYSHGTSGVAHAFLELYAITGHQVYKDIVISAFAYEKSCFNSKKKNWPDFRSMGDNCHDHDVPCISAWCHGAPGIALTRMRAYEILGDSVWLEEAIIALDTTRFSLEKSLHRGGESFSLCHGLMGNTDIILSSNKMLPNLLKSNKILEDKVAQYCLNTLESNKTDELNYGSRFTPSLMTGLSGIGYFYLRMHSEQVSSILFHDNNSEEMKINYTDNCLELCAV